MKKYFAVFLLFISVFLSADQFVIEFCEDVNIYRQSKGLNILRNNTNLDKIANAYSAILGKLGTLDHHALSNFEFSKLCEDYGITEGTLGEVLCSFPTGFTPDTVLGLYKSSKKHNEIILDKNGSEIGAGYVELNGRRYFTAYVYVKK